MSEENEGQQAEFESSTNKRLSGKKLLLLVILPLVLLGAGGFGMYTTGKLDALLGKKVEEAKPAVTADDPEVTYDASDFQGQGVYYDLPDMIVNLSDAASNRQRFLKLSISIELSSDLDKPKLDAVMPRITDHFQTYLRELRVDDLRGSAGIYRLRQELLSRVRSAARHIKIRDVLFREILVQ